MEVNDRQLKLDSLNRQIAVKESRLNSLASITGEIRRDKSKLSKQTKELKQQITLNKREL